MVIERTSFIFITDLYHLDPIALKHLLDKKVKEYNHMGFIEKDPICIPHQFQLKQDIEISGLFASLFAWGKREIIIGKLNDLMNRMDYKPFEFLWKKEKDWHTLLGFKHRTIKEEDCLSILYFLKDHYKKYETLESAFSIKKYEEEHIEQALIHFQNQIFSHKKFSIRSRKHISSPLQKSSCKRLCMFLRWMVRNDEQGVDFGHWKNFQPSQLVIPMDVHVSRVAFRLGLISSTQSNWNHALQLTHRLKELDALDPVKYDYALFSLGVEEKVI